MRTLQSLFFIALFALALTVSAQAESISKEVAAVNLEGIMRSAKASKSIHDQVESLREKYQKQITDEEESLRSKDKKLAEQRENMTKEAFEEAQREFKTQIVEAQRDVQTKRAQLDRAYSKALGKVQMTLSEIIQDIAKDRGYKIVFPSNQLLYADESMNISEEVLNKLDDKLPNVEVKIEPLKNKE